MQRGKVTLLVNVDDDYFDDGHRNLLNNMQSSHSNNAQASEAQYRKEISSNLVLLGMASSCFFILSSQRISMSIAIVDMVNWTAIENNSKLPCFRNQTEMRTEPGTFSWSYHIHNQVLACYFYGLALGYLPAVYMTEKMKVKWVIVFGIMLSSICNIVTPVAAKASAYYLMIFQVIKAICHNAVVPAFNVMIETKISVHMATSMGYALTAFPLGAFFTLLLSGVICTHPSFGWEYIFYFSGAIGIIWTAFWTYLVCDYFFPTILNYRSAPGHQPQKHFAIPVKAILTSTSVWGLTAAGIASSWAYSFNLLLLPIYMRRLYQIDIEWNSIISSAPNLLQAFFFLLTFLSSDRLLKRDVCKKTFLRKFHVISGLATFGGCHVVLTVTNCSVGGSMLMMTLALGFIGSTLAALAALPADMSPQFASVISIIINTLGPLIGSLLPLMVTLLSESKEGMSHWNRVFYASILLSFISMILFLAFGSAEVQKWDPNTKESKIFDAIPAETNPDSRSTETLSIERDSGVKNPSEEDNRNPGTSDHKAISIENGKD